jgi:FixJ family two-component response regulator
VERSCGVIAVIDDDESIRKAHRRLLRAAGYPVQTFASAEEWLDSDQRRDSLCLILDVRLPGLSGPALQQYLNESGCHIPIVFVSANADEEVRKEALREGAIDYLLKPLDPALLLEGVCRALATPWTCSVFDRIHSDPSPDRPQPPRLASRVDCP